MIILNFQGNTPNDASTNLADITLKNSYKYYYYLVSKYS